jgi:hypothetical protein
MQISLKFWIRHPKISKPECEYGGQKTEADLWVIDFD